MLNYRRYHSDTPRNEVSIAHYIYVPLHLVCWKNRLVRSRLLFPLKKLEILFQRLLSTVYTMLSFNLNWIIVILSGVIVKKLCLTGYSTGSPSSKYEHWRASALLRNIQNIRICMGKKPIVSVTYENERISILKKNSLPYLQCVLRLSCVVHFIDFYVNGFLSIPYLFD